MKTTVFIFLLFLAPSFVFAQEGHRAGYNWAGSRGIDDPDDCHSATPGRWEDDNINNSASFTEGCLEYLQDEGVTNDDELKSEDDDENEDGY